MQRLALLLFTIIVLAPSLSMAQLSTQAQRTLEAMMCRDGRLCLITMGGTAAPALSSAGQGRIYFDSTSNTFKVSTNGGAYTDLSTGGVTGLANPTASVGLTAVNGTATTAMRSDGAPALSQAIAPTWSQQHQWTPATGLTNAQTINTWVASGASATALTVNASTGATANYTAAFLGGNVGIGTTTPQSILDIVGSQINQTYYGGTPTFQGTMANGTQISPTQVLLNDRLFVLAGRGWNSSGALTTVAASVTFRADENFTSSGNGTDISFETTATGATSRTERMRITNGGNVGIGTASPGAALEAWSSDAVTNALTTVGIWDHESSGTPAAEFGLRHLFNLASSTTASQNAAAIDVLWTTATHASRAADMIFSTYQVSDGLAERVRITSAGALVVGRGDGGTPVAGTMRGPNGSGTNINGVATTVQASLGTGTGTIGTLVLSAAAAAQGSGASAHTASTHQTIGSGLTTFGSAPTAGGTKFTITGCSAGTTVGGNVAGSFVSGTTGTCTVVITLNGATGHTAPNGWACRADNLTTPANLVSQSATSTTTCTVTGTTVSGDVINFVAFAY